MTLDEKEAIVTDLYNRKASVVKQYCKRFVPEHEAEELVHDIFINVMMGLDNFRGDANIDTWLYKISQRACYNMMRYKKGPKRGAFTMSLNEISEGVNDNRKRDENGKNGWGKFLEDKKTIPALQEVQDRELVAILHKKIDELPNMYRECILAFYCVDDVYSYAEVAKKLGISSNSVRSRFSRARMALKREMKRFMAPSSNG